MDLSLLDDVFVIVFLVFCVLDLVMAVLRPTVFISSVRGFTSKDAESDDEMQEQIKPINWKKGVFRLTLVLSVLFGTFAGIVNTKDSHINSADGFLIGFSIFFVMTWLIYFATSFVIKGFASKK